MTDKPRRCPSWCAGKHELTDTHMSAAPFLGLGLYAHAYQRPGSRKHIQAAGVPVRDPYDADALARLIERLADAPPEVHRALAEQVRAAAVIAFGAEVMEGLR